MLGQERYLDTLLEQEHYLNGMLSKNVICGNLLWGCPSRICSYLHEKTSCYPGAMILDMGCCYCCCWGLVEIARDTQSTRNRGEVRGGRSGSIPRVSPHPRPPCNRGEPVENKNSSRGVPPNSRATWRPARPARRGRQRTQEQERRRLRGTTTTSWRKRWTGRKWQAHILNVPTVTLRQVGIFISPPCRLSGGFGGALQTEKSST